MDPNDAWQHGQRPAYRYVVLPAVDAITAIMLEGVAIEQVDTGITNREPAFEYIRAIREGNAQIGQLTRPPPRLPKRPTGRRKLSSR